MNRKTLLRTWGIVPLAVIALVAVVAWLSSSPLRSAAMSTTNFVVDSTSTPTPPAECLVPSELDVVVIIDRTGSMISNSSAVADPSVLGERGGARAGQRDSRGFWQFDSRQQPRRGHDLRWRGSYQPRHAV